ncbi:MAG: hypothetical protein ACRENH_14440 [Gemmatimonadaceae bacterium]
MIVLTDDFATIRRVVEHLSAQSIGGDVELVVVCPSVKDLELPAGATSALGRVTVVECSLLPLGTARASAVRAATAPIIVLGETHAFPAPDWAEQLIRAHDGPWQSVAPGMLNANPESARSWSGFLMDYGRWLAKRPAGEIAEPPAYNASWKREALLRLEDRLPLMLEPGGPLDQQLVDRGAGFYHEPKAGVAHLNIAAPLSAWAAERYWGGRLFGARRSRAWPLLRRLVYFAGAALVPLLRMVRTRPAIADARRGSDLPRGTTFVIAVGCLLWALGEAMGYIAGEGRSESRMLEYELHKERYT